MLSFVTSLEKLLQRWNGNRVVRVTGHRVNTLGRVGSGHGSVSNTHDPGLLTWIRRYKDVLSVYWCAVTVSVFGSSGTSINSFYPCSS